MSFSFSAIAIIVVALYVLSSIKILAEDERGVIFRLGRLLPQAKGPGIILVFAPVDRLVRVSLRQEALKVPPQDIIQGLVGESGIALTALSPNGKVFVHGELWDATSSSYIPAGERVVVRAVDGLELRVEPAPFPADVPATRPPTDVEHLLR